MLLFIYHHHGIATGKGGSQLKLDLGLRQSMLPIIRTLTFGAAFCSCLDTGSVDTLNPLTMDTSIQGRLTLNVQISGYCPAGNFQDFWASNYSVATLATPHNGKLAQDFDRDGIPDVYDIDALLGISPRLSDTNGDGYHDLLIYQAGLTLDQQASLAACPDKVLDSDGDGLTDCEEINITHTNPNKYSTKNTGIPDGVAVRFGINPNDATAATHRPAGDGMTVLQKIKAHTPVAESRDTNHNADMEYQYVVKTSSQATGTCYDFTVNNITLARVSNGNLVKFFFFYQDKNSGTSIMSCRELIVPWKQDVYPAVLTMPFSELDTYTCGES